jgi:hypothetical protein
MNTFFKKSAVLFGGALAICAFAVPMASGASWAVVGTTHVLASSDLSFTATNAGGVSLGSQCLDSEFHADVTSASVLTITGAAFRNCMGTLVAGNCTTTATAQNLPWTATAVTTTNIQIHGIDVNVAFENTPGNPTACAINGATSRLTGTLTGGSWDPSSVGANRRVTFNHASGLTSHSVALAGPTAAFVTGAFRDTAATLNVFD